MQAVMDDFNDRVREIERYIALLKTLEEPDVIIRFSSRPWRRKKIDNVLVTTLKASTFLLLYNLIESAIRGGIGAIYEAIKTNKCTINDVNTKIATLWIDQQFAGYDRHSASLRNFQDKTHELVRDVLGEIVLELNCRSLPVSGNLDADQIRAVCSSHGISFKTHKAAKGGYKIELVRQNRNALAHGDMSFSECGRQFSVGDLEEIKKQTVVFTRSILGNIRAFVAKRNYAS